MNGERDSKRCSWWRLAVASALVVGGLFAPQASAQVPARFYWKPLSGTNAVPVILDSMSGNTNPFDSSHQVNPGASIDATLALAGYARVFSLFGRGAMAAALVPMGRISGDLVVAGQTLRQSSRGFGDPTLEFDVNLIGPRAQESLVDVLRFEPGFSLDLIADLAVPIGRYDDSQVLNLGQHRWYGRLGLPIVWQLGEWVPDRRTTLELLPAVWLFGANDDYVGHTLETDPMFQLDIHLTRDLFSRAWASLDGTWYAGGAASVDGVKGESLNKLAFGATLGYQLNDNLGLTFGYKTTVNDSAPGALRLDGFMVSLVTGWHSLVEGVRRLGGEK